MLFSKKGKPPPTPPKEESANRLQTRYSSRYRYGQTLEYGHKNGLHTQYSSKYRHEGTLEHRHTSGLHARYSSICRHKRTLDYECKSGLHARRPSLYSQRGQTLCYIRQARKLGLPPFGRVGVGFWRTGLGIALQSQPLCRAISTILRVNLNHFTRRYSLLHWQ